MANKTLTTFKARQTRSPFNHPLKCMECGRGFLTEKAAAKAVECGCPKCGGTDIDLNVEAF